MGIINIQSAIEASGLQTRKTKQGFQCQCPYHSDGNGASKSLYVSQKDDGKVMMFCHSHQCKAKDILASVGLSMKELFPANNNFNKSVYRKQKTQKQIEDECIHAWLILNQKIELPLSNKDKQSIAYAEKIVKKHSFTEEDYQRIESERQFEVVYRDFMARGGKYGR